MSHGTGITASEELRETLAAVRQSDEIRVVKIQIMQEQLQAVKTFATQSTFETDFGILRHLADRDKAAYFLVRLDSGNEYGSEWMMVSYVPTGATSREKMLYSSTKAALKTEFGGTQLKAGSDYLAEGGSDLTLDAYLDSKSRGDAPPPLSEREIELNEVKRREHEHMLGLDAKVKTSANIGFPPTEEAVAAIRDFNSGALNFAQFVINGQLEQVELLLSRPSVDLAEVDGLIPRDRATYNIVRLAGVTGEQFESDHPVLFFHAITSLGGVKEKMLFSSCKSAFLQHAERDLHLVIHRKVEIDIESDPVTPDLMMQEVTKRVQEERKVYAKPAGPAGRKARSGNK